MTSSTHRSLRGRVTARSTTLALCAAVALSFAVERLSSTAPFSPRDVTPTPRLLGPTSGATVIDFSLSLRGSNEVERKRLVRDVHDPASARYRQYIDAGEYGARFGVPLQAIAGARRWLGNAGFWVGQPSPQRILLRARGSAALVRRVFDVRLADFVDSSGRRYHAPLDPPTVPRALRRVVGAVTGLNSHRVMRPAAVPAGGVKPKDVAAAYNITPLHRRGIRGRGQTVAILSFDSFEDADVAEFDRLTGTRGPLVERVNVQGETPVGEGEIEVNLDIDTIRGIAPKAQILNYQMPNEGPSANFATMMEKIAADGRADVVSVSWGHCDLPEAYEGLAPASYDALRTQEMRAMEAAAAQGISVFVASGDAGAYDCQHADRGVTGVASGIPAASSGVIAVGGTLLSVRADGSYLDEWGWEDILSGIGSGGGLSRVEERPAWQTGRGVDNKHSNGRRQVPDVAGPADPDSGMFIVVDGKPSAIGGTSAAAPFWAGSMVLARQLAQREGAGRLGYLNPILYRIARREPSAFHDVTKGGNRLYNATAGWDYATGLGSPDVARLARAIVEELRR